MKTNPHMHPAGWRETIVILVLLVALIAAPAAAADFGGITLPDYKHIDITMANGGDKYIKFDGGGLNALHITTDPSERYGQVTETSTQSGTFYFSDTGGRGFFDDLILMVAVQGEVPDNFKLHVRASGYQWTPTPVLNQPPTMEEIAYSEGFTDRAFTKSDFIYAPQTWKPCREANYPIYYGQDMSKNNPEDRFHIMFVDLGVGAIGPNSFLDGLTDGGCAKIEYSFENMETFAAFNAYGWCNQSNQGRGISWSNDLTGFSETGISGYSVQGTGKSGDTGGSGSGGGSSGGSGAGSSAGSGIKGSTLNASTTGSINGTLNAFTASGPAEPLTAGSSSTIRIPVAVPEGAKIDRGFLYVYVSNATETATGTGTEVTPAFGFDGKLVTPAAVSWDRQGTGSAPMAGTFTLAIPPEMLTAGDRTLTVQIEGEAKVACRVPAALLVLVVSDPTRPRIDYWIGEGCDDVLADLWEGTTEEDATTEVKIDGTIDRDRASAAQLYVVSTAEPDQGGVGNRVVLNTWDWLNPLQEGPTGVWAATLDVLPFIKGSENIVKVQSYPVGIAGDHLQNRNAILVIRSGAAGRETSPGMEISSDARKASNEEIGSFALTHNATGMLEEELRYRTGNGEVSLVFPEGSRITNGTGAAVSSVTIRTMKDLPPVPGTSMERVYCIAPEDATAENPFAMTAHGQATHDAVWYRYDTTGAAWQQVNTTIDLLNGTVTAYPESFGSYGMAMPLPAALTVSSNPAGARIHLDGEYTGKVTPAAISPAEPGDHTLRLELEQFVSYEANVTVPDDTELFADLSPEGGFANLARLKFGEPQMEPGADRTGGIYITSRPSGATISIDGKKTVFTTPHVILGIREGSHTVRVLKEGQSFNTPTKTVWVERDCITPVQMDALEQVITRRVTLASDDYAGNGCTINGKGPVFRLPKTVEVAGGNSFVTMNDGDRYISYKLTVTEDGGAIEIAPRDYSLCGLLVESSPAGAEILVDGFRTGLCTPYLIRNVSDGQHVISVTRPGYLPAEKEIRLTDDQNIEIDARVAFRLEPYPYGSLHVTSEPAGAQIYLYNKNTGETTPHTFQHMPIGTYEVKVVGNATFRTADDITVRPYEVTERVFNLV